MNNIEMNRKMVEATREYIEKGKKLIPTDLLYPTEKEWKHIFSKLDDIQIWFDLKGTAAGKACYGKNAIRYNTALAYANLDTFMARTVPHEVAHFIAYYLGDRGHGRTWKRVMVMLGVRDISRCHSYDTSEVRKDKGYIQYHCSCRDHLISPTLHRKIRWGQKRWCRKCKGFLEIGPRELPIWKEGEPLVRGR